MKTNITSLLSAILIAVVLPSCVPVQGPPPGYGGGSGPNYQDNGPVMMGPGPEYGPTYHNGGAQYPGGYRQIGDPRRTVYGNGPQSYASWGPVPQITYGGPSPWVGPF